MVCETIEHKNLVKLSVFENGMIDYCRFEW